MFIMGFLKQFSVLAKLRQKSPMKKGIVSFIKSIVGLIYGVQSSIICPLSYQCSFAKKSHAALGNEAFFSRSDLVPSTLK